MTGSLLIKERIKEFGDSRGNLASRVGHFENILLEKASRVRNTI